MVRRKSYPSKQKKRNRRSRALNLYHKNKKLVQQEVTGILNEILGNINYNSNNSSLPIPHEDLIADDNSDDFNFDFGSQEEYNRLKKQQEEAQGVFHDVQQQETSGPSFNIKEEITIDESVLEDYLIPKLETFENASADTKNDVNPLSLSYMEIQTSQEAVSRCTPETTVVSPNIGDKSHNENANFANIIPKLETFDNTSEDILRLEENVSFPKVRNQPVQETTILRSTLKDNTNFSPSSSNTSQTKKRKCSDQDSRVEDHDFPNIVQVKSENREDYVDYAMYIAARLINCNQSDNAIAIAKEKIELLLCDLDKGVFENLIGVPFSCNI